MAIILGRKPGGGGGGGAPSGPAGGDLAGTYPNPTIDPTAAVISVDGGGGQLAGDVTLSAGSNITLTQAGQDIEIAAGGLDPVADILGAPTTAFEFNSSSLAGLTAIGTPDTENADTSVPGSYFLMDNAAAVAYVGRYVATPAMPFTVVTRVTDSMLTVDFNLSGLFVGVANPAAGAFLNLGVTNSTRTLARNPFTNPSTAGGATNLNFGVYNATLYLAMVANSSTDVDLLFSYNGSVWSVATGAHNPGFTIASCGIGMASVNANGYAVAFDYLRIWNSAKAFPGVP